MSTSLGTLETLPKEVVFNILTHIPIRDFWVFTRRVSKWIGQISEDCAALATVKQLSAWPWQLSCRSVLHNTSRSFAEKIVTFSTHFKNHSIINHLFSVSISQPQVGLWLIPTLSKCNITCLKLEEFFPDRPPLEQMAQQITSLTELQLCIDSEADVKAVVQWSQLRVLKIDLLNANLSSKLTHVTALTCLSELAIGVRTKQWTVQSCAFGSIQAMTCLQSLSLKLMAFPATESLTHFTTLRHLHFEQCTIANEPLQSVATLKNLSTLHICSCQISEQTIEALKNTHTSLTVLTGEKTDDTDDT
jgi:hypothetical protein